MTKEEYKNLLSLSIGRGFDASETNYRTTLRDRYIDSLEARITEQEKLHSEHLDEMRLHYEDVHAEEVNELNARIAELEAAHKWNRYDPEDDSTYPPRPYQLCLVFGKDGMPKIAVYGDNNKWYTGQDFVEVSHWLPLPKYPNQERGINDKRDS